MVSVPILKTQIKEFKMSTSTVMAKSLALPVFFAPGIRFISELPDSPEFGGRFIAEVDIEAIEKWKFNPGVRTEAKALADLDDRFDATTGQLMPGAAVWADETNTKVRLVDAHRRLAICIKNGIKTMLLIIYTDIQVRTGGTKFAKMYEKINGSARKMNTRERTSLGLDGQKVAAGIIGNAKAELAQKYLNEEAMALFKKNGCPNSSLQTSLHFANECKALNLLAAGPNAFNKFVSDALIWTQKHGIRPLIEFRTFYGTYVREGKTTTANRLRKTAYGAIVGDQALPPRTEWVKSRKSSED